MAGWLRGCLGRLLMLGLLVAGVGVAWANRDELGRIWDRVRGHETPPSPELAARADAKLASLSADNGVRRVALTQAELQSLIDYRWGGILPPDVVSPRVQMSAGRLALEAGVATARFGRVAELSEIVAFLPDTADFRAVGLFVPMDSGYVALEIHELGAARIPLPRQLIPAVLSRFRGHDLEGLGPNALAVPLPPGISTVFISGDSMVFVATRVRSE